MTMRALRLFIWLASALAASAIDYPTTIELDVVFPRNETYNSMMSMPLVFAIQNAEAAFEHGYSMTWIVNTWGTGNARQPAGEPVPAEASNNTWYEYGNFTYFDKEQIIQPGTYNLSISFIMGTCTDTSSTVTVGVTILKTSVEFTVVDDGSGKDVDFTGDGPQFLDTLTIERLTGPVVATASCPVRAESEPEGIANTCRARISEPMAECVLGNITGRGDSACSRLPREPSGDGDEEGSTNDTSQVDSESDTNSDDSMGVRQYGSTVGVAALTGLVALACLW